jgi:hypothetical protein
MVPAVLASCASSGPGAAPIPELTRIGEAVEVTDNTTSVQECEFIVDLPLESAANDNLLRNTAGDMGANTVLVVRSAGGDVTRAEGYLCGD